MFRNILTAIILIIGGILASYGIVIQKAPDLKEEYDKIIPYQGIVGVILLILGLIDLINIFNILAVFKSNVFFAFLQLAALATKLVLGFVLSFGLVTKYVLSIESPEDGKTKSGRKKKKTKKEEENRKTKTNGMYKTLTYVQVPFGIVAILLGLLTFVFIIRYAIF